jgi:hypothetical protein
MAHFTENGYKTYPNSSGSDIAAGTAVKLQITSGIINVIPAAAATDKIIGVTVATIKNGYSGDVRLRSCGGTLSMRVGSGAGVSIGDAVTSDASGNGLTTTTAGNQIIGYALETVAASGIAELLPSTAKV